MIATALAVALSLATASSENVDYGLFGTLHVTRPAVAAAHVVLLFSDRDGWTARQDRLGAGLAAQGALVVGIDTPAYLARMATIGDACSFPSAHVEEVAHWIERRENLASYSAPFVVGDGSGATFAYAMSAQSNAGTFAGLLTLGWDAALRFGEVFCPGDAGAMTAADDDGRFRVVPAAKMVLDWWPQPFARGARIDGLGALLRDAWRSLGVVFAPLAEGDAARDLGASYAVWLRAREAIEPALPDDVADLPLTDIPAQEGGQAARAPKRIAIILTGDGGWAGLDRGVADALTGAGIRVIGLSTLKFFWQKQTPDAIGSAVARIVAHYGKADADARFVLIGYSFGASLIPVVVNRLPEKLRARVDAGVLISPDDEAVFEIHVGDWFGSTHHDGAVPLGPEMAASKVPLVCVHGSDEDDSFCLKPQPTNVRVVSLAGGHHYDGDFAALGALVIANLP